MSSVKPNQFNLPDFVPITNSIQVMSLPQLYNSETAAYLPNLTNTMSSSSAPSLKGNTDKTDSELRPQNEASSMMSHSELRPQNGTSMMPHSELIHLFENIVPYYDLYDREFVVEKIPSSLCNEILHMKKITDTESKTYVYSSRYTENEYLLLRLQNCLRIFKELPIFPEGKSIFIKCHRIPKDDTSIEIKNEFPLRIGQLFDIFMFFGDAQMVISKVEITQPPRTDISYQIMLSIN
jgi:hypothetical protein